MFVMIGDELYIDDSKIIRIENIGRDQSRGIIIHRYRHRPGNTRARRSRRPHRVFPRSARREAV